MIFLNSKPIIQSLLDTDAYKLYMQQAIFHNYSKVMVVVEFFCRSNRKLGDLVKTIVNQLNLMNRINLTLNEYHYLSSFSFFKKDYLDWLSNFRFNPSQVHIYKTKKNQLGLQVRGRWCEVTLWEVPLLSIISEVFYKKYFPKIKIKNFINELHRSIDFFYRYAKDKNIDLKKFFLVDFGTRRRFSKSVQIAIVKELKECFPYFLGTSNYKLAKELKIKPIGTQSHEWFQAHQQICVNLIDSQKLALQVWLKEYPKNFGITVTDCITTDVFFRDFNMNFVKNYQGLRHDSGDPIQWGKKVIDHYKKFGINLMKKTLVFSDNLDFKKSLIIYKNFYKKINLIFAIGTGLTCNFPTIKPLNIVIKLIQCNGGPVAKISDSLSKSICKDNNFFNYLKKVFDV